jgi:hypothetical protein
VHPELFTKDAPHLKVPVSSKLVITKMSLDPDAPPHKAVNYGLEWLFVTPSTMALPRPEFTREESCRVSRVFTLLTFSCFVLFLNKIIHK